MKQKKLMLLGGLRYLLPVIEAAHKQGYYVITADYLPDNIAHKYSDEYCNVSIIDKEAKRLQIDGITSFACDSGVVTAAYVAEKMGLPHLVSSDTAMICCHKGKLRKSQCSGSWIHGGKQRVFDLCGRRLVPGQRLHPLHDGTFLKST